MLNTEAGDWLVNFSVHCSLATQVYREDDLRKPKASCRRLEGEDRKAHYCVRIAEPSAEGFQLQTCSDDSSLAALC